MSRFALVAFVVFLVFNLATSASPHPPRDFPGFSYLGKARTFNGRTSVQSDYYLSTDVGMWQTGRQNCHNFFDSSLVSIETEEEQNAIRKWLLNHLTGVAMIWTSGQYMLDRTDGGWYWDTNAAVYYTNWLEDNPTAEHYSRIAIKFRHGLSDKWVSAPNTHLYGYICEIQSAVI